MTVTDFHKPESDSARTPLEREVERVISPLQSFIRDQTTASVLLVLCTLIALAVANSPFAQHYEALIGTKAGLTFGDWTLRMCLQHWGNEGLMSLFFSYSDWKSSARSWSVN